MSVSDSSIINNFLKKNLQRLLEEKTITTTRDLGEGTAKTSVIGFIFILKWLSPDFFNSKKKKTWRWFKYFMESEHSWIMVLRAALHLSWIVTLPSLLKKELLYKYLTEILNILLL